MTKRFALAATFVMGLAVAAWACPPDESTSTVKKEGGCHGAKATTVADKGGCCAKAKAGLVASTSGCCKDKASSRLVAKVMESLPRMTYKVGDKATGCPMAAAELAKETDGAKVTYIVADEAFEKESEAQVKLAALLDGESAKMLSVRLAVDGECVYCPMRAAAIAKAKNTSVKYRVAGVEFNSFEQARSAIDKAKDAVAKVTVTIRAGDAEKTTASLDDQKLPCGEEATFTVAGEETHCPVRAKLLLAQAKIRAMVEAAATLAS